MFQPKYTMNGLEVDDSMTANGNLHSQVLRIALRSKLEVLQPSLREMIAKAFDDGVLRGKEVADNWVQQSTFMMTKRVITAANSLAFFGPQLSKEPKFLEAALDYPEDLLTTAEILRLLSAFLAPFVAPILMKQHRASKTLVGYLTLQIDERLRHQSVESNSIDEKPVDCTQFFIDANLRRGKCSVRKLVQIILGIWFASVHQPALSLVYALDDLCTHPEYVPLLRAEIQVCHDSGEDLDKCVLLDSFLKESARLHPSDSISCRRKVLQPYTFADGTHLFAGDVACVPSQAIMRDPLNYMNSLEFNPYRFLVKQGTSNLSRFTDTSPTYPLWGLGKRVW